MSSVLAGLVDRLKAVLTAWRDRLGKERPPPPPDPTWPTQVADVPGAVADVLVGRGWHRVVIIRDEAGLYRLQAQAWAPDWGMSHEAAWHGHGHIGSVCDSLARARALAEEELALMGEETGRVEP